MLELAVLACAVFAIFVVVPLATTIATVPVTCTVVVLVVAEFVAFVLGFPTLALAFAAISLFDLLHKCGVQTLTFFVAVLESIRIFLFIQTAITSVPTTDAVIVGVVTSFILDPVHLDMLLGCTRLHVRTRSLATAHAAYVLFTDALVIAVMARLG